MSRVDLTDWCTHFVHLPDPSHERFISGIDGNNVNICSLNRFDENGDPIHIEPEPSPRLITKVTTAYDVLLKILYDGYIKSSWSIRRNEQSTNDCNWSMTTLGSSIYGPSSCVCFTEMPLYAYDYYVNNHTYANFFGIAIKKEDIFQLGAKPAIYGLSCTDLAYQGDQHYMKHAQNLGERSGIGLSEQYRYVVTNIRPKGYNNRIDWTHEREWRWTDIGLVAERNKIPGIGIFLRGMSHSIKEFVLLVDSDASAQSILCELRILSDIEDGDGRRFYTYRSKKIWILSRQELKRQMCFNDNEYLRLDDINWDEVPIFQAG